MRRIHFFEIEDQPWCPKVLRDGVTDFLQHIVYVYHLYKPVAARLADVLTQSTQCQVIDLCAGGAGPWLSLIDDLQQHIDRPIQILLTDLYPNLAAFQTAQIRYPEHVSFIPNSVDATQVPENLKGFRTLFSSFHHLNPEQAQAVLQNAVDAKTGIAIFESTQRHPLLLLYMLITPLLVWLNTPFMRPFRWSRLFWTYVVPIIPFIVMFDGIVSCLRTYTPEELQSMVAALDAPGYEWDIGLQRIAGLPVGVTYLIGYPT